jgi:hypothetical protein
MTTTTMTTTTTLPRPTRHWTLAPELMVRVAGLPFDTLDGLRCPRSQRWAPVLLDAEDALRREADLLGDELAAAIGTLDDQRTRRALLGLRRDVHNLRRPPRRSSAMALAARVSPATALRLGRWLAAYDELDRLRQLAARLLDLEAARSRSHLQRLLADPRLRSGLLLAAPALEAQLGAYTTGSPRLAPKRARKVERSAVSYAYRVAAKPSPFSTFTAVAPGVLAASDEEVADQVLPERWTSRARVSVVVLSRLYDAVLADPARRADLPLVPASGWVRDADRVRYVRRSVRGGDAAATVTLDSARDQLFFLRRSDLLEGMLELVSRDPSPLHREVAAWLADRLGAGLDECEHYLGALLDLGLLQVPLLATDVHTTDPLRTFQAALGRIARPWADELATSLAEPVRCLDAYPDADPEHRRTLLAELRHGLAGALHVLGAGPESLPSSLLYEDATATERPLVVASAEWRPLLEEPLRSLERVLPAFDQTLRHRRTLHGFFLARFGAGGRCDDLLRLVHDFHEDIYEEYQAHAARTPRIDDDGRLAGDPNWLADPAIEALDRARRLFADRLGALVAARPQATEVEVPGNLLDEVAALVGHGAAGFTAVTHFLQRAGDLVVHNSAFGGLAFPFSRFTHWLDEDVTERLRARVRATAPADAILAEVTGGFATTNLNLHRPLTDHEIVCPGEVSVAPPERRIPLADLVLEHDVATDRLRLVSGQSGREVVPVYLGYLVPQALPAISRTLLLLSPSTTYWLDPWAGAPSPPVHDGVGHRPRVRMGNLVLSRRSWTVDVGDLPAATTGRAGADPHAEARDFLEWQRWRRRHGIPDRVFATVRPPAGATAAGPRPKPQLLDFGSVLSLGTFRAGLPHPDSRVELTELLPDQGHLHVTTPAGAHVAELAVETVSHPSAGLPAGTDHSPRRGRP